MSSLSHPLNNVPKSRNKNVSKEAADPSSKLKLTLKKEGADSIKSW
jgi:hypothetical protein